MPATARKGSTGLCLLMLAAPWLALTQTEPTPAWLPVLAKLASSLSQNDPVGALNSFDPKMKDYGVIESNIEALASQAEVVCAFDVILDSESAEGRKLDVDWFMELKSNAEHGPTERRRERVQLEMKKIGGKWKITSLSPLSILAAIHIN